MIESFASLRVGDDVEVKTPSQHFHGVVTAVETDPDPYDSIEATHRVVLESAVPHHTEFEFWVERTSAGRLRLIKRGNAGLTLNVNAWWHR